MGKGIALSIKRQFPEVYKADLSTSKADAAKLGTIVVAEVHRNGRTFFVVNGYTQFHWRGVGVLADYDAIRRVMRAVKVQFQGKKIAYPEIGAGLAGGDWDTIVAIISDELDGADHTFVEFAS
ncbi:macro domain-containing protein [Massilia sp. B-10]|nr:macro domain-containing protein [Massilia sp. B-10]